MGIARSIVVADATEELVTLHYFYAERITPITNTIHPRSGERNSEKGHESILRLIQKSVKSCQENGF